MGYSLLPQPGLLKYKESLREADLFWIPAFAGMTGNRCAIFYLERGNWAMNVVPWFWELSKVTVPLR